MDYGWQSHLGYRGNFLWRDKKLIIHKPFQAILDNSVNLPGFVGRTKTSNTPSCFIAMLWKMVILLEPKQNLQSYVAWQWLCQLIIQYDNILRKLSSVTKFATLQELVTCSCRLRNLKKQREILCHAAMLPFSLYSI